MPCKVCTKYDDLCQGRCDMDTQGLPSQINADEILFHRSGVCTVYLKDGLIEACRPTGRPLPWFVLAPELPDEAMEAIKEYLEGLYEVA